MLALLTGAMFQCVLPGETGGPIARSIAGRVWLDDNADGIPQATEPGVRGVEVRLLRNRVAFYRTVTGAGGRYSFPNVPTGNYRVRVMPPVDKYFTTIPDGVWPKPLIVLPRHRFAMIDFGLKEGEVSEDLDITSPLIDALP